MADTFLLNLPAELIHHILDYCDVRTILFIIGCVCKKLRAVVLEFNRIELQFDRFSKDAMQIYHLIPKRNVASVTISSEYMIMKESEEQDFFSYIHRFPQHRYWTLRH